MKESTPLLWKRERLASLGQLMGGIAQSFKAPIMSISDGLDELNSLVDEYEKSIENENVSDETRHEIASRMRECLDKINRIVRIFPMKYLP